MQRNWPGDTNPYFYGHYRSPAAHQNINDESNFFSTVELQEIAIKIKQFLGPSFDYENVRLDYIHELSRHLRLENELTESNLVTIKYYLNAPDNVLYAMRTLSEAPIYRPRPPQSVSTSPSRSAEVEELRARMFRNMQAEEARRAAMTHEERDAEDEEHMRRSRMAVRHGGRLFDSPM